MKGPESRSGIGDRAADSQITNYSLEVLILAGSGHEVDPRKTRPR
jgi:hypothetical protein